MAYGLMIDYEYCSGCHTCEVACQQEHGFEATKLGIEIKTMGPTPLGTGKWQYDNIPTPTAFCNHCAQRVAKGKTPSCVQHCQAGCMEFGDIKQLAEKMTREKMVLFTLA